MEIFIISDVHGRVDALTQALTSSGIIDDRGVKKVGIIVVQIGDLANCVDDSVDGDLECLSLMETGVIDYLLVGNHEIPYFDDQNRFSGFHINNLIGDTLWQLNEEDKLGPSFLIGETLITHAGISSHHIRSDWKSSENVHEELTSLWEDGHFGMSIFSDVGRARYGRDECGGILWCDFDNEFVPTEFPQIVGHTPGILRQKGNAMCIDTGAKNEGVPTVLRVETYSGG